MDSLPTNDSLSALKAREAEQRRLNDQLEHRKRQVVRRAEEAVVRPIHLWPLIVKVPCARAILRACSRLSVLVSKVQGAVERSDESRTSVRSRACTACHIAFTQRN
eukprot:COSAG06_NODE_359_length_16838_cov_15.682359_1_plen_105_part_10